MLEDLYLLQTYFAEPAGLMREDDLITRYGGPAVAAALAQGLLVYCELPCSSSVPQGCRLCRLSASGLTLACAEIAGAGLPN